MGWRWRHAALCECGSGALPAVGYLVSLQDASIAAVAIGRGGAKGFPVPSAGGVGEGRWPGWSVRWVPRGGLLAALFPVLTRSFATGLFGRCCFCLGRRHGALSELLFFSAFTFIEVSGRFQAELGD